MPNRSLVVRGVILLLLGSGTLVWVHRARARYLPDDEVLPGLRVDGVRVTGSLHAVVHDRAAGVLSRKVHLVSTGGDDLGDHTLGELGVAVDEDDVARRAARIGHEGDLLSRAALTERASRGEIDVPLAIHVDARPFVGVVASYKESLDVAAASARLDLEHHGVLPERAGRYLDAFGALAALESATRDANATEVIVPFAAVAPRVTSDFVSKLDVESVLGSFDTWFSRTGDQKQRGQNIDVAASKLDGVVLMPGEIASFNGIVGDRSEDNGFQKSWQIYKGEMVEGVGGGTCQVASTLHAAAFFAGLDVVERLPHSRPSGYIPMGLDSTVVYPIVDLKLRNPYDFPVVVHAKTDGARLTIQLLGTSRETKVKFTREVLETKPYPRKVEEDPKLAGTKVLVKQHGIPGYKIKRSRVLTFPDGHTKTESSVDVYPPTTEIYAVPPDFDPSKLPPLPAGDDDDAPESAATTPQDLTVSDAPGAHAPTTAQKKPEKSLTLVR